MSTLIDSLLPELAGRDIRLVIRDGRLVVKALRGALDDATLQLISAHKAEVLAALQAEDRSADRLLTLPLPLAEGDGEPFGQREFDAIKQGHAVKVWSGTLGEWLVWVRDDEGKRRVVAESIDPWRVYTLAELAALVGMTQEDVRNLHAMRCQFVATLVPAAKPERLRDAIEPMQPKVTGNEQPTG